jgi:hypothetical protein
MAHTNNLSDLTGFFNGFNKDADVQKELSEETNEKLVGIGKSFKSDAKLQKKLVKWSKIDMGMDVAAFIQDKESKGFLAKKQKRDVDAGKEEAKGREMEGKIEEHGSINNDLLARIEIVLVTRLDRILDGIKLMLPALDKDRFKGSEFDGDDFSEAVEKSQDINNKFLKKSIDELRHERYNRKNRRELEEVAALRKRGKTEEADDLEKKRKAKEMKLEGFNPDGTLMRNKPRGYYDWKIRNNGRRDEKGELDISPIESSYYRGNLTGKMSTSPSKMGGMSNAKAGMLFKASNTWYAKLRSFMFSFGKLFVKGGAIGILIYSIMPLIESLKSDEMAAKWDEVKGSFLKGWEKLKTSGKNLWIKIEPIVTTIDHMFKEIGKTVGGWLGDSIIRVLDGLIDIFDGFGMLHEGDIQGAFKTILIGKDGKGGIINMLGNIVIDAVEGIAKLIGTLVDGTWLASFIPAKYLGFFGLEDKATPKEFSEEERRRAKLMEGSTQHLGKAATYATIVAAQKRKEALSLVESRKHGTPLEYPPSIVDQSVTGFGDSVTYNINNANSSSSFFNLDSKFKFLGM